jgi:hypothetical protein
MVYTIKGGNLGFGKDVNADYAEGTFKMAVMVLDGNCLM